MLGGALIDLVVQRQQLVAPDTHSSEMKALGTGMFRLLPIRGILQELHIPQVEPTPVFADCASTVHVARDESAAKRSVWTRRLSAFVTEQVSMGEAAVIKIDEFDNVADDGTKVVPYDTYMRHMHYTHNLPGDPPPLRKA